MTLLRIVIIGLILVSGIKLDAQTESSRSKIEQMLAMPVDKMAERFLKDTLMKSLTIGVYYKGEEFIQHYGELDQGKNNKPTDKTIYDIGSDEVRKTQRIYWMENGVIRLYENLQRI